MSTIRTAIELQDNFTGILYQVIDSVNLGLSAMGDLNQAMNAPVDMASLEAARDSVNQATLAVRELDAAIQGIDNLDPGMPQNPAPVILPVHPEIPDPLVEQPEPVQIPVHWQSDSLEVFTGSGIERFWQEVQSTNTMLGQLSAAQDAVARQAYNTNIFPPQSFQDLNRLAVRVDSIRERIQQIEKHPLNVGTDTANTGLEMMRGQLAQAIQEQQELNRAMDALDTQAANEAYLRLQQTIGGTERYIRDNVDGQGRFTREIQEGTEKADGLMQAIKGAVAAYATIQTFSNALNLSDQLVSTTARLNMMNDGLQTTEDLQNMIYLSAERSRGSYQATADAVSKLGLMAGDAFSSSEEIIAFMEQVNKQFRIAGTEASGIDAAMLQLTQAMGSGVLRGEEYNSILEQAPNIIQAIADYLEVPKGELKDMAADGVITADIVKAAMFAAADETNAKFESMPKTFEQIWTSFENTALMAFQPVLNRMNEIGNSDAFQEFANGAVEALAVIAGVALGIFNLLAAGAGLIADNWSWLSPVIYGVAGALGVYYGAQVAANAVNLISHGIHVAMAAAQMAHAAATGSLTAATAAGIAAQNGLNAAMYACPLVWIIILIIALVALFYAAVAAVNKFSGASVSATGMICGAVATAAAFILNTGIGAINALIQSIWHMFAEPFLSIVEWILNVANGGFDSFGGAVANLIGQIISWFLSLGKVVTKIIDAIFGTDWTSGLNALQNTVLSWGKNDSAITLGREAPAIDYRIDYGDAWEAGRSFGEGIDESIANFDPSALFGISLPNAGDYADLSNYSAGIGEIAKNTGKMADGIDITGEELKYLRDIAEQETVNRFTTAEIHIEQTNHNTIKNGMDLDGVMSGMTDMMNEAIDISAEGGHN